MQQHRQPGMTYAAVTFRRDGGWRRSELFTARGLECQAQAARFGVGAAVLWGVALLSWFCSPPNKRLKLAAPVLEGTDAFLNYGVLEFRL